MRIPCDKAALLVLLLLQLAVALAPGGGGATQRTIVLGHSESCGSHRHSIASAAHHERAHTHHTTPLTSHSCTNTPTTPSAMLECCPCPHIHLRLLDGPLARGEPPRLKDSLPRAAALIPLAGTTSASAWRSLPPTPWDRGLLPSHPPPAGLASTILLI